MNVFPVACHTDNIGPGSVFVAIKGQKQNGVDYIMKALQQGATTIVVQQDDKLSCDIVKKVQDVGAQLQFVENSRQALADLSAKKNGYPAKKLKIVGVTGTKGKTSTAFMLEHILQTAGYKTALLSTVHNKILTTTYKASLTTAQPDYLHAFFSRCVDAGVEYVVMEVAAQALTLHRVAGVQFDGVVFTNFSQEHAEFYSSMDDYFAAKCLLFESLKPEAPVLVNNDDRHGEKILQNYPTFLSFGLCDAVICAERYSAEDTLYCRVFWKEQLFDIFCQSLFGQFNVYNMLGAVGLALQLGVSDDLCKNAMKTFSGAPGRLERYQLPNGSSCFIDYAHNPSSFEVVLSSLRLRTKHLIVLFGSGGERDRIKRPTMGAIASKIADHVVITSDNPRSENVHDIIDQIYVGVAENDQHKITCEADRKTAIEIAYRVSQKDSIIALLGKGPDEYELIGDKKIPFSEKTILKSL